MSCPPDMPAAYREPGLARRIGLIAWSYERLLQKPLVQPGKDVVAALWSAPSVVLAHGTEPDPVFFFGNRRALDLFGYDADELLRTPSRLSAEAPLREERQALLDRVAEKGFIDDYSGIRITATGRRFRIDRATVWSISDEHGVRHGQAATFVA